MVCGAPREIIPISQFYTGIIRICQLSLARIFKLRQYPIANWESSACERNVPGAAGCGLSGRRPLLLCPSAGRELKGRKGMKCGAAGFLSLSDRSPILALMDYRDRIVIDPEIRFGKPSVRGTRITVGDVLSYLASGMSEQQILADFPQLTRDDIRACLAFAAERERRIVSIPAS